MTVSDLELKKRTAFDLLRSIVTKGRLKRGYKKPLKELKEMMKADPKIRMFIQYATKNSPRLMEVIEDED